MRRWTRAVELDGRLIGSLRVLQRVEDDREHAVWRCRCKCGRISLHIGSAMLRKERAGAFVACRDCCREYYSARRMKGVRKTKAERYCHECMGQRWRRPYLGHCPGCHKPWGPDVYQVQLPLRASNLALAMNNCWAET